MVNTWAYGVTVIGLVAFGAWCKADVFPDLETLGDPTALMVKAFNRYIEDTEKKLEDLRRFATRLQKVRSRNDGKDALSMFMLINTLARIPLLLERKVNISDYQPLPTDPSSAALALFRLQDTYALDAKAMADGNLVDGWSTSDTMKMTASDCFDLGKAAFDQDPPDYYHALLWFQEALERVEGEDQPTVDMKILLVYLALSLYYQDNLERAAVTVTRLKRIAPNLPYVDDRLHQYTEELKQKNVQLEGLEDRLPPLRTNREMDWRFPDVDMYERLCRGEVESIERQRSKRSLFCYLKSDTRFLRLAPLKAEQLHLDPEITVIRKAISRKEADAIKSLAKSKLERSVISTTTSIDVARYRTSKTAWLADADDPIIARVSKRIEDISGLSTTSAENLQVANYELGGHYMPHFDFAGHDRNHQFANLGTGDRIATVLFYLSDTLAGGATVFPSLRLTVYPQENDALLWYNLLRNGEGDRRTRHAACPVLLGVKWITNKWLHEYGQEFRRPCGLREGD